MSYLRNFLLVMSLSFCCSSVLAEENSNNSAGNLMQDLRQLRQWSILPGDVFAKHLSPDALNCTPSAYVPHNDIWVKRPGSRCCVALIRISESGRAILNPEGFAYGPIPKISEMTRQQADALWQSDVQPSTDGVVTYKLTSFSDKPEAVFIDVKFSNEKVDQFRLRAERIVAQE